MIWNIKVNNKYIEDITRRHEDLNIVFEWWKQYCRNKSEQAKREHINFILYTIEILITKTWTNIKS